MIKQNIDTIVVIHLPYGSLDLIKMSFVKLLCQVVFNEHTSSGNNV